MTRLVEEWDTISFAVGFTTLMIGVGLLSIPAALILGGGLLLALPFLAARRP